jgi:hypothetical protein
MLQRRTTHPGNKLELNDGRLDRIDYGQTQTSLTVPIQAIPSERQRMFRDPHSMSGQCQTFKPHHCRIFNRRISRMDHNHCP